DIAQAARAYYRLHPQALDAAAPVDVDAFAPHLAMSYAPEPDLFIRTGGERRVSNFLLWQLAYTELHFTDQLWPDFDAAALDAAIASYGKRERRFGSDEAAPEARIGGAVLSGEGPLPSSSPPCGWRRAKRASGGQQC